MRVFRWILLTGAVVLGLLLVAIAVGGSWLNSFIHSDAFKTEVEARASKTLGGTVVVQTVDFDIFNGVKLQGLATQLDANHAGGLGALKVNVESANCAYAWRELLNRNLRLTGVTLEKPQIVLTTPGTDLATPSAPAPVTSATSSSSGTPSGPASDAGTTTSTPFQFELDRARIIDGAVSVRNPEGASLLELQGVALDANTSGYLEGKDVTGTLAISQATVPPNYQVTNFSMPFTSRSGDFQAKAFSARAFGGNVAGDIQMGAYGSSILDVNAKGMDVSQITATTSPTPMVTLTGLLDLQSKWRGAETGTVDGEGDAQFTNGKLTGVRILQDLSGLLKIRELNDPIIISKAVTHFQAQDRRLQLTGLQVDTTILRLTGDGAVGFDGDLNLNLVLILSKETMGRLPKTAAASFVAQADGTGSIAFHVTGTTSNPETDLPSRLLMQNTQIKNVIDKALNRFFR